MRIVFAVVFAVSLGVPVARVAARPPNAPPPPLPAQAATAVVGVEGGGVGGTDLRIATDLANVLNGPDLRVVPIVGQGSVRNLDDLLHLRGVDVAVVQADVLSGAEREKLIQPGTARSIQYIAKLLDEEVHVVAGPDVRTLDDLRGKTINADLPRSGSALTARLLFATLGIPVTFTPDPQEVAIERLKRGEIAAVVRVTGKPADIFLNLPADAGLHLLALPRDDERLLQSYAPGSLTHADYPNLVPDEQVVDTLTTGGVLAVYAWPQGSERYRNVAQLVRMLFARLGDLQHPPAHPKWKDVNLSADVPGWTRFPAAAEEVARVVDGPARQEFARFFASGNATAGLNPIQRAELLQQYLQWRRTEAAAIR